VDFTKSCAAVAGEAMWNDAPSLDTPGRYGQIEDQQQPETCADMSRAPSHLTTDLPFADIPCDHVDRIP
jgi:hypothetical protein